MKFQLEFSTDNAAYADDMLAGEVARTLIRVANRIEAGVDIGPCPKAEAMAVRDYNGNTIGTARLVNGR